MKFKNINTQFAIELAAFAGAGALGAKQAIESMRRASIRGYNLYDETGIGDREIVSMVVPAVVDAMDYLYGDTRFSSPPDTEIFYDYVTPCASRLASDILTKNDHHSPSASALKWLEIHAAKAGALKEEDAKAVAPGLGEFKTLIASTDHVSFADYQLLKSHAYREEADGDDCPYWIINHPVGVQIQPVDAPCWAESLEGFGLSPRLIANMGRIIAMGYGSVLFHEDGELVKGLPRAGEKI